LAKLNIDSSFLESDGSAGISAILRDYNGETIFTMCKSLANCSSALETELAACVEGLRLALQWTLLPVAIETDYISVVHLLTDKEEDCSTLAFLVREARWLRSGERTASITKIQREQNLISHELANKARRDDYSGF
jgi:ribonuclease HI